MSNSKNKKSNQVIRDIKECFRSFHLPVYKNKNSKDIKLLFTSQICNDHVCADLAVTYDRPEGYIGIDALFCSQVPAEKLAEIVQLLNLFNRHLPVYNLSVCQCCNTVTLRSVLFLSGEVLPKGKFRRLIREVLEDTYLCYPLIAEVVKSGNSEVLYDRFMNDHRDAVKMESKIQKEVKEKILLDMELIMTGLKISINEECRFANGFIINCMLQSLNFPFRMSVLLNSENEIVVINLAPTFTVPQEKTVVLLELVNQINRILGSDHMFIHPQTKRVILIKALMIDNGILDQKEFDQSLRTLFGSGSLFFPIIEEQISSNESPEVLLAKMKEKYQNRH